MCVVHFISLRKNHTLHGINIDTYVLSLVLLDRLGTVQHRVQTSACKDDLQRSYEVKRSQKPYVCRPAPLQFPLISCAKIIRSAVVILILVCIL